MNVGSLVSARCWFIFVWIIAILPHGAAFAEESTLVEFDIDAQELGGALTEFGVQSGTEVYFVSADVAGVQAPRIEGEYSAIEVIQQLLGTSGVEYFIDGNGTLLVGTAHTAGTTSNQRGASDSKNLTPQPVLMAQSQTRPAPTTSRSEEERDSADTGREGGLPMEEIVVIGTNIRGIAPDSSPTRTFTREDIQISGAATAQDFIKTLPQNFGGGSNDGLPIGVPTDDNASFNRGGRGSLGSSVNLRGLGSGSTLVLLNGHRLAPSSGIGDFVDISLIPASAIERVEVMTDGASSIYGADAVAGVVNFVLRSDFDGAEATLRYGSVTEGDLNEYLGSIAGGKSWNTGNALFVYEYFRKDNLSAGDRSFSQIATTWDLLPEQERHSVLVSARHELTAAVSLFGDFTFSRREALHLTGATLQSAPTSRNVSISAGGSWKMSDSWYLDFSGTYGEGFSETDLTGGTTELLNEIDSSIGTADAKISGTLFSLPGGELKLAVGGQFRTEDFLNFDVLDDIVERQADRTVYAAFGEAFIPIVGPSNVIPGIDRLELNVSGRFEDTSDFGSSTNPKIGVLWSPHDSLNVRGSYSTSFNPPPLGRTGAADLRANAFFSSFINSVLGLTPGDPSIADVVTLLVSGTAKNLGPEESTTRTLGVDYSEQWGRHSLKASATWFDIDYENRLGTTPTPDGSVLPNAPNIAINSPELFPEGSVIFFPSQSEVDDFLASVDILNAIGGAVPADAEIINLVPVARNLGRTLVRGLDFDVTYTFDGNSGTYWLGLDGTLLDDFKRQAANTTPLVEEIDTLFNPVGLRLRGRVGYRRNSLTGNIFINYTDDYRVDNTSREPIDSWTTVDMSLSYELLNNIDLRLSVLNLFDRNPPSTPGAPQFGIFGYDATNASPLNRFIAFEVTKRF